MMTKIRSLKELNARIHELEQEEQREKNELKKEVSTLRHTSSNIEFAFYIGKIAAEIFKIWRKPAPSNKSRWKNIIFSILMIVGIHLAQQYLDQLFSDSEDDNRS